MREPVRYLLGWFVIVVVLSACFAELCRHPGSLLVDPVRPSVDQAIRGRSRGLGNDLTSYYLPRLLWVQRAIKEGGSPSFWDQSGFAGRPRLGNPQAGLFYPLTWPILWLGGSSSLGWLTVGHLGLGGFGLLCLARISGFSTFASTIAGISYAANPYMMAQVFEGHYPHVWSACWYPWAFLCWKRSLEGSRFALLALPLILALMLLTGHPQEWYYLTIALGCFAFFDRVQNQSRLRIGPFVQSCRHYLGSLGLCLGLCAVEIVPDLLAQRWTVQSTSTNIHSVLQYNVQLANLLQWFHPFALGSPSRYFGHGNYWETQLSIGLVPLFLLFVGLYQTTKRPGLLRWIVLGIACLLFAAGPKLGLFQLCYQILPGMDRFRVASRTLFLANLGWAICVAAGIDAIRDPDSNPWNQKVFRSAARAILVMIISLSLILVWTSNAGIDSSLAQPKRSRVLMESVTAIVREPTYWLALGSLAVVSWMPRRFTFGSKHAGLILGVLAVLETIAHSQELLKTSSDQPFLEGNSVMSSLPKAALEPFHPFRVASMESVFSDLTAARLGLEKTNVNDGFQVQNASLLYESLYPFLEPRHPPGWGTHPMDQEAIRHKSEIAQAVLDRMSVQWVITEEPLLLPRLSIVAEERDSRGKYSVAVNRDPLPRAYVVPRSLAVEQELDPSINWLRDTSARDLVRLEVADPLPRGSRQSFRPARYRQHDPDHRVIEVETEAPGLLVVTNTWNPGWSATLDGDPARVLRGNLAQQVVALPKAGRHRVELRFRPAGWIAGFRISVGTLIFWSGLMARSIQRRRIGRPGAIPS